MKARFNRVPLLTFTLLSGLMGGCGLLGGSSENANVQQAPQPANAQVFPSPAVPAANSSVKVALTRPTNPDDRLRVIKTGRNDPFGLLVAPQTSGGAAPASSSGGGGGNGGNTTNIRVTQAPSSPSGSQSTSSFKTNNGSSRVTMLGPLPSLSPGSFGSSSSLTSGGSRGSSANGSSASSSSTTTATGSLNLPALPPKPELAGVKVTGVVLIAGAPRAIVEAPGEPTSRTVGIGDSLSNGQLYVKDINASNSAEPVVIFRQGDVEFSVAVGRAPVLIASAGPMGGDQLNPSVRGLYPAQSGN